MELAEISNSYYQIKTRGEKPGKLVLGPSWFKFFQLEVRNLTNFQKPPQFNSSLHFLGMEVAQDPDELEFRIETLRRLN